MAPSMSRSEPLAARKPNFIQKLAIEFLKFTDRTYPWYKWPLFFPLVALILRRIVLRLNLVDVPQPAETPLAERLRREGKPLPDDERPLYRTDDAYGNDGANPDAGARGATIGRNMASRSERAPTSDPSPQLVAQKLLARRDTNGLGSGFQPAGMQLNIMAAAWIQSMIHDWQDHELDAEATAELAEGARHGCPMDSFNFRPTRDYAPTQGSAYLNIRTGWWDASFVYGQDAAAVDASRTHSGGQLRIENNMLPVESNGVCPVGDQRNSWVGVGLLQDLFAREHNAIAAAIAIDNPGLDDEHLFRLARLAIAAIVAKIHTIDWTVELLKTKTLLTAMRSNWFGLLNLGPLGLGLVGRKKARNHGVKFSLTEEFTAVYRMHTLLPDVLPIDGEDPVPVTDLFGAKGCLELVKKGVQPFWRSALRYPCGALTLFNYPRAFRELQVTDDSGLPIEGRVVDLAAMEIYRDRERGIQRYNDFRRRLNMNPVKDWNELTGGNAEMMAALTEVYGDDIEACDLLIGNFAEKKIPGFAISETSFNIFILMASRRLEADRFLTEHFNEKIYGKIGFNWVKQTHSLRDVLKRHYPELEKELPPGDSAFTPYEPMPDIAL